MSERRVSLYETLEVAPTSTEDEIRQAVSAVRRKCQLLIDDGGLSRRQFAEHRLQETAVAEQVLLDPGDRAAHDWQVQHSQPEAPLRVVIPARGTQTSTKLDLLRVVEVGTPSPGPMVPQLNADKSPVLSDEEAFLHHLTGEMSCLYQPWPTAPNEEVWTLGGTTTFYLTADRLIYVSELRSC